MRGTCKYVFRDVLRVTNNNIMIELIPDVHEFTYFRGGLYRVDIGTGTLYLNEHDFHKYFSVEQIKG